MDIINEIRRKVPSQEFDYQMLTWLLSGYANPRSKIRDLLRKGAIVRIKKGIYIFGENYRNGPYSTGLLANWIYGPSIVSMETMLSWYGLIPERVYAMTSTTTKRPKEFRTPIGLYTYQQVPIAWFPIGITRAGSGTGIYLAATPERALADKVRNDFRNTLNSLKDAESYLFEDLRIDEDLFGDLDPSVLLLLANAGKSRKVEFCAKLAIKMKKI